jgi:tetratricopeptide (TPR) repeat protein
MLGRYLLAIAISLVAIMIGWACDNSEHLGIPAGAKFPLHELGEVGKYALVLLIGPVLVLERLVDTVLDRSKAGLKEAVRETFGETATTMNASFKSIEGGFKTIEGSFKSIEGHFYTTGKVVETGFLQLSDTLGRTILQLKVIEFKRDWSAEQEDEELAETVPQSAASLAREGKIDEAKSKIESKSADADPAAKAEKELVLLLLSHRTTDWEEAAARLLRGDVLDPSYHMRLSYKFWTIHRFDEAIKIAEVGLELSRSNVDMDFVTPRLENNLAYFYAEGNRTEKAENAFQYIQDARRQMPLNVELLETEGCVKIAFSPTQNEALDGLSQLAEAGKAKGDMSTLQKWLERYNARTFD